MANRNPPSRATRRRAANHRDEIRATVVGVASSLFFVCCAGSLWAGTANQLTMHWAMEPWPWTGSSTGVLETEVAGASATLENFPENGSEWIEGVLGRALVFDGVDRHVQHNVSLPRIEGTIGHWLRPTTASGTRVALYESDFTGAASPDYNGFGSAGDALEIHTGTFDGDYYAVWQDGGISAKREVRGGTVIADEWTHVAVTWSIPGQMKLYVNCEEVDSVAMDAAFEGRTPTEHLLGKPSQFDRRHWPGAVDEVKVWDREFNAAGVRNHFCPELQPETNTVLAPTPAAGDRFGSSAALSGDWLLVSSPGADEVSWFRQQGPANLQFSSSRPASFSHSLESSPEGTAKPLDIDGPLAAVADVDGVDVLEFSAPDDWNFVTTLSASGTENFGFVVSVSGDRIAVGAPSSDGGSVVVFERDQGGPNAWGPTFADSSRRSNEFYGELVDLDGDLLAFYQQAVSLTSRTDRVELYRRGELGGIAGWAPAGAFTADAHTIVSLAVRGDRVATGLVGPSGGAEDSIVVVRRRNQGGSDQWGIEHFFVASDADRSDQLGANLVWLNDTTLAAAAPGTDEDHQAIYIFRVGGAFVKSQQALLVPKTFDPITENTNSLGRSLTGSGGVVIAGATFTGFAATLLPDQPPRSGRLQVFLSPEIFADGFESEL